VNKDMDEAKTVQDLIEWGGSLGLLPSHGILRQCSACEPAGRQAAQETVETTVSEPEMTNALV